MILTLNQSIEEERAGVLLHVGKDQCAPFLRSKFLRINSNHFDNANYSQDNVSTVVPTLRIS
jgi:hypothetical protein